MNNNDRRPRQPVSPHASQHAGKHKEKYNFEPPNTMKEAKELLREVTFSILNVEKQLGDEGLEERLSAADYQRWREKTKSAKIYMISDQQALKDWILNRRRAIDAKEIGIWKPEDPRTLLQHAIIEGRLALDGKPNNLARVLDLASLCLIHDA